MSKIVWKSLEDSPAQEISKGISVHFLWKGDAGAQAIAIEIAPGAKWEGIDLHEHNAEEIFVVDGIFNDGVRDYQPGTFIHCPVASSHIPQSKTGCRLFVFYPEIH